ncbi:MAG: YHS domain-containing protein [Flavobacteriaceae bacterium]|jgi:YHS domain-containing protein|uniref:YHS domain-containing (seleno)protein n=1 Tax=Candidatus Marifrigoribacter sp. Uisw_064 TaxID=3230970 RepID=UPI003ADA8377
MKKEPQFLENGKALKGHDPLSVYDGITTMGNENINSSYKDAIYQFKSIENKKTFDMTPEKYAPKYGGYCSIAISEGSLVPANPHSALVQNGALHVFYKDEEEDTKDEWNINPIENKKRAEIEWGKLI